jgi:hypothetical protein
MFKHFVKGHRGLSTDQDADELSGFVRELKEEVISWLKMNHPSLA